MVDTSSITVSFIRDLIFIIVQKLQIGKTYISELD